MLSSLLWQSTLGVPQYARFNFKTDQPRAVLILLAAIMLLSSFTSARGQDVLTFHNDNARTGVQNSETSLNLSDVNVNQFGKVFSLPTDADAYAQPLYVSNILMNDGAQHNVLFVATEHDAVYAFDADGKNPSQGYLWKVMLLGSGESWVSSSDINCNDINPDIGITSTPVIDKTTGTIYVVAKSKITSSGAELYRLHALKLSDGTEKLNGPTLIAATVPGTATGGTTVAFNAKIQNQRASLLLAATPGGKASNSVFIGWGSHCDANAWHGWVISYDASDIAVQTGAFLTTPDGPGAGVWMGGGGPAADSSGNIYFGTGNGQLDANGNGRDYGDASVKLTPNSSGVSVADCSLLSINPLCRRKTLTTRPAAICSCPIRPARWHTCL